MYSIRTEIEEIFLRTFNINTNFRLNNEDEIDEEVVNKILEEVKSKFIRGNKNERR